MRRLRAVAATGVATLVLGGCSISIGGDDEPEAAPGSARSEPTTTSAPTAEPAADPVVMEDLVVPAGPFADRAAFVAAADDMCTGSLAVFARTNVISTFPPGAAMEMSTFADQTRTLTAKMREMEAPGDVSEDWEAYLTARDELASVAQRVSDVNAMGEQSAIDDAWDDEYDAEDAEEAARTAAGLTVCGSSNDVTVEDTGTAPDPTATWVEPNQTVDEVVGDLVEAYATSDCARVNDLRHAPMTTEECRAERPFYEAAEVVGTADFGPVSVATIEAGDDEWPLDLYFVPDSDGDLRMGGGTRTVVGTLHPATEGSDSDEVVQGWIDAVRANDDDAFNSFLSTDQPVGEHNPWAMTGRFDAFGTDPAGSAELVTDLRADTAASAQRLGLTRGLGYYLLDANGHQYVLGTVMRPGSATQYWVSAYWRLPDPV